MSKNFSIADLEDELKALIRRLPAFKSSGFSMYSLDEISSVVAGQSLNLPVAAVGYDGAEALYGNDATPVAQGAHGAVLTVVQFLIVIGLEYRYTPQGDSKRKAFDLLDQVRSAVLGYKGVNSRPWQFVGERPEPDASTDGVVYYSQVWRTVLPTIGIFNNV